MEGSDSMEKINFLCISSRYTMAWGFIIHAWYVEYIGYEHNNSFTGVILIYTYTLSLSLPS